ncbi:uncharacterized protein LOC119281229 isoform X2 [Triticum dicoccoides]|uniref:uncharacterized protein LOC119281229 isoform X2 n=1 Tax=Triticum dicoccoides TaxID=85692 RepID=UPI00188FA3DF|nr:uncharacterized protein LOC119281229 isoform X2 [Triticum dicoccoides]
MRKGSLCLTPATGCGGQTRALAAAELPEPSPARMENRQNTGLKKRKLLGTVREQEPAIKEMCQALKEMESKLKNLRTTTTGSAASYKIECLCCSTRTGSLRRRGHLWLTGSVSFPKPRHF